MTVANYIHDLLFRHDCVIVPNFGGFITNRIGAQIQETTHTFYPPTKQISFNAHLKHNDGLLINYISKAEDISFDKASEKVINAVISWKKEVKVEGLKLDKVGRFSLSEKDQLIFEPLEHINYLSSSFGLSSLHADPVKRREEKIIPMTPAASKSKIGSLARYAAAAAVVLSLSIVGWNGYQTNMQQKEMAKEQKKLEDKIQSATFIISDPLPTVELNVTKEVSKPYHVVAGSFQFLENAEKKVTQLKAKGFNATILGKNKWGLTQVAYESFTIKTEAFKKLAAIRKSDSKDAWLLVKRFQ